MFARVVHPTPALPIEGREPIVPAGRAENELTGVADKKRYRFLDGGHQTPPSRAGGGRAAWSLSGVALRSVVSRRSARSRSFRAAPGLRLGGRCSISSASASASVSAT